MHAQQSIKESHRKILHRVKRDRPGDRPANPIAPNLLAPSFTAAPPEVKRPRLTPGVTLADFGERTPKFSTRNAVTVLEEAFKSWESGDRQIGWQRLREFSIEHLQVLSGSHIECACLLVRLAAMCRWVEPSEACLRYTLCIMEVAPSMTDLWRAIFPLIVDEKRKDCGILQRFALDAFVLSLFQMVVSNGLLSDSQMEVAREVAARSLHSDDYERRIAAINFHIAHAIQSENSKNQEELLALEKLLCDLSEDRDSRVRYAAVKGLSTLSESRKSLSFYIYSVAKKSTENTEKFVRIEALRILKDFADRLPETEVSGRNNVKLRLVDDAFTVVCHAINDIEVLVRAEAAKLLGTFEQVSDCFLDQTLDKKLLNAMRMSKTWQSASRRPQRWNTRRERYAASTEWSTGKKLGEDVPAERIEDEQASIIPTGACGALITALEDEFMVVRQAGVYSLGRLAANRSFLAAAAIDNLSDMFNDEIEQVRLDAIYALTPLVVHGVLHKEQLDTMLTVLDDASPDSREALRVLLMKATMDSPECMRDSVRALLNCLRRFPIDESSIFQCLSDLGRRHGSFVEPLVVELLGLNAVFEITEPELDDSIYMAKLMLVLNAASVHDPLCSLLPEFVIRHYRYLRSSMPDLIPFVKTLSDGEVSEVDDTSRLTKKNAARRETLSLLESLYDKVCDACKMDSYTERSAMLKRLESDFEGLSDADGSIAGTARFVANMVRMLMQYDMALQRLSCFSDFHSVLDVIDEGLEILDHGDNEFRSVDATLLGVLAEYRFRLRILRIAAMLDIDCRAYTNIAETLTDEMDALKERLTALDVVATEAVTNVLRGIIEQVEQCAEKKFIGGRGILAAFQPRTLIPPEKPASFGTIATKWVEIVEPNEPFKDPIRFKAGLPMGVPFNILLHNFDETDVENFRIKIGYSTQRFVLYRPRKADIKYVPMQAFRFLGDVLIESNAWSTAGVVRVSCVLLAFQRKSIKLEKKDDGVKLTQRDTSSHIKCIPLLESPFSSKLAYKDVPIYPMIRCSF
ncbi:unnamed protein product [Toxocara canis]|uniref:Integrator complex subunit 4 n=1 Tax=Toxocara canis TaxID=6265 RepID=A0A183V1X3_TOXCA|nr:unnamed protein product [Toxocara canis]